MNQKNRALIFELSQPGRTAFSLPECDVPQAELSELIPEELLRDAPPDLPEVSEVDLYATTPSFLKEIMGWMQDSTLWVPAL